MSECPKKSINIWMKAHPEWKSSHTKIDASGQVMRCFIWADDEDMIERLPFRRPKRLWSPPRPREPITVEEYRALLRTAKECNGRVRRARWARTPFRMGIYFLWETGARTCEMREARFSDVDWQKRTIVLVQHKTAKSVGVPRIIPLGRAYRLVRWLCRRRRPGQEHIFVNAVGKPWTKDLFARLFRSFATIAGVRSAVSSYSLRHGFAVNAIENGVGIRQVADVLGHEGLRHTSYYARNTRFRASYLSNVLDQAHGRETTAIPSKDESPGPSPQPLPPDAPTENRGAIAMREEAARRYAGILPAMKAMRDGGATFRAIAEHLNGQGAVTLHGKPWGASRVRQVLTLGCAQPREHAFKDLEALDAYKDALPIMTSMRAGGATYVAIAEELNLKGIATRRGHEWTVTRVWIVLRRADNKPTAADAGRTLPADVVMIARELQQDGKSLEEIVAELANAGFKTARGKEWTLARVRQLLKHAGAPPPPRLTGVNKARHEEASQHDAAILPAMLELKAAGKSNGEIAAHLNGQGLRTREGALWNRFRVREVLALHCPGGRRP